MAGAGTALLEVLCSLAGWSGLYALLWRISPQRGPEWNCRLVTLTHGVAIVMLTAYVVFVDGPWPLTHAGRYGFDIIFFPPICAHIKS